MRHQKQIIHVTKTEDILNSMIDSFIIYVQHTDFFGDQNRATFESLTQGHALPLACELGGFPDSVACDSHASETPANKKAESQNEPGEFHIPILTQENPTRASLTRAEEYATVERAAAKKAEDTEGCSACSVHGHHRRGAQEGPRARTRGAAVTQAPGTAPRKTKLRESVAATKADHEATDALNHTAPSMPPPRAEDYGLGPRGSQSS